MPPNYGGSKIEQIEQDVSKIEKEVFGMKAEMLDLKGDVKDLVKVVITGNGDGTLSLQEKWRLTDSRMKSLESDSESFAASLKTIEGNSSYLRGREEEKKKQIDDRVLSDKRRNFWITAILALFTLIMGGLQYHQESSRAEFEMRQNTNRENFEQHIIQTLTGSPPTAQPPSKVGPQR